MKKLFYLFFISILLTGCFDFKELKNVSFCFGIGVDYDIEEENKYLMTIETEIIESHSPKEEFSSRTHSIKGNSFVDARSNLTATTSSLIDFTHCQLIIISHKIKLEDMKDLINSLFDNTMIPNSVSILISTSETASEILETSSITNASVSFEIIYALKENGNYYDSTFKKTITEAYNDLNGELGNFYLPAIKVKTIKDSTISSIEGALLFNNFEYQKYMDHDELRDALIINRRLQKLLYELILNDEEITIFVDSFKRKVKVEYDDKFNITFGIDLVISTTNTKQNSKEIEDKFKLDLKDEIGNYFKENKDNGIDVFNLITYINKHNYKLYKKHENQVNIQNINLNINLTTKFKDRGVVR